MKYSLLICSCAALILTSACKTKSVNETNLIPQPVVTENGKGNFVISESTVISFAGENAERVAISLASVIRPATGFEIPVIDSEGDIILSVDTTRAWKPEEYQLDVERKKVTLTAGNAVGLFRGIQTIRQLLPPSIEEDTVVKGVNWTIPCVSINDYPGFSWRGMHLDVSRHFFDVEFVKHYIDLIAMHKMNVFHWHLTDDQGWRIEIKKYPLLTEVGAWRADHEDQPWNERQPQHPGEEATYGGFYTQEQIKEVVAYAAERYITVVPEIEMPAHVGAALAAYPEYSCTGGPFTVPTGGVWPITDIYCAGRDETFSFIEDILTEVMELFPSEYIHIGGDEANKKEWKTCRKCQERIRKEGLKNEAELQSYFIKRVERFISAKGRKLLGWDEILEGELAPGAAVQSWRGFEGGIEAARAGHNVVMSPVSHCYFDYYQGDQSTEPPAFGGYTTLKKVYLFEPVPDELTTEESRFIMGAQANLWTEMIPNGRHAEYMVLPRMTALSEVLWSPKEKRNWADFSNRLITLTERFDTMDINYSKGTYRVDISVSSETKAGKILIELNSEQADPEIRYTTDGTEPGPVSALYTEPFTLDSSAVVNAVIFRQGKMMGKVISKEININLATGKPVTYNQPYSAKYRSDGPMALVNCISGSLAHDDGCWQGFEGNDMDIVIDLGKETDCHSVSAGFLSNPGSWIFLPQWVEFSASTDGEVFTTFSKIITETDPADQKRERYFVATPGTKARYIKIYARSLGVCPPWHEGDGSNAWLFADEIFVE